MNRVASHDITSTFSNEVQTHKLLEGATILYYGTSILNEELLREATTFYGGHFIAAPTREAFIAQAVERAADKDTLYITNTAQHVSALRFLLLRNRIPLYNRICIQANSVLDLPYNKDIRKATIHCPGEGTKALFEKFSATRSYEQSAHTNRCA